MRFLVSNPNGRWPDAKFLRPKSSIRRNFAFLLVGALLPIQPVLQEIGGLQVSLIVSGIVLALAAVLYLTYASGSGTAKAVDVSSDPML